MNAPALTPLDFTTTATIMATAIELERFRDELLAAPGMDAVLASIAGHFQRMETLLDYPAEKRTGKCQQSQLYELTDLGVTK